MSVTGTLTLDSHPRIGKFWILGDGIRRPIPQDLLTQASPARPAQKDVQQPASRLPTWSELRENAVLLLRRAPTGRCSIGNITMGMDVGQRPGRRYK
jgi:hypothetical protein